MVGSAGLIDLHRSVVLVSWVVGGHDINFIPVLRLSPVEGEGHKKRGMGDGNLLMTPSLQFSLVLSVIQKLFLLSPCSSRGGGWRWGSHLMITTYYVVTIYPTRYLLLPKAWNFTFLPQLPSPYCFCSQDSAPFLLAPPPPVSGTPPFVLFAACKLNFDPHFSAWGDLCIKVELLVFRMLRGRSS